MSESLVVQELIDDKGQIILRKAAETGEPIFLEIDDVEIQVRITLEVRISKTLIEYQYERV